MVALVSAAEQRPRTLLISLDAVPYWVIADLTDPELGEQALFREFKGPIPMVSTFPSSTSVAMVGMLQPLGLGKSPGYEARFFDWERLKTRGGGLFSYSKIEFPWREFFDVGRRSPAGSAIEAVTPVKSGSKRLRKAVERFLASEAEVGLIYIAATDIAVHVVGPDSVKRLFIDLDATLTEARTQYPDRPFETLIWSDHGVAGGEPLINVSKSTKKALKQAGYRVKKKLKTPQTVVMTPFGLVSNFEAYTHVENIPEVARILAGVEGVALCAFGSGDNQWTIAGPSGQGRVERREGGDGLAWRYEVEGEDPLGYTPVVEALAASGEAAGWIDDGLLFDATKDHRYPDAFYRIADAFELVLNPGSIVCSTGVEHMYGAGSTAALATLGKGKLRWTHGALNSAATMGFLMSDAADWQPPDVVRYDEALLPFQVDLSRHVNVSAPAVGETDE
jgi:hypothetical protein